MAEKGLPAPRIPPTPKTVRPKISEQAKATDQAKGKEFQRNPPKENPPKQKQDSPIRTTSGSSTCRPGTGPSLS